MMFRFYFSISLFLSLYQEQSNRQSQSKIIYYPDMVFIFINSPYLPSDFSHRHVVPPLLRETIADVSSLPKRASAVANAD